MHTPTLGEVFALIVMGIVLAAVLHAGLYSKHRRRAHRAAAAHAGHPEPPKKGDRIRLLVGIPDLKLAPGAEGRITLVHVKDDVVYFVDFGTKGFNDSVMFSEAESWHFEVIR